VNVFKTHVPGWQVGGFYRNHHTQYGYNSAICRLARLARQLATVCPARKEIS
jgi:hypothetical protein